MPPESTNDSPLERMRKRLYTEGGAQTVQESTLQTMRPQAPEHWKQPPPPAPIKPKRKISAAAIFLGCALAFFVIAGGVTAFVLFMGGRSVSSDHVEISVQGPTTVAGGEGVPLLVTIKNSNPVALMNASLTLQYPEGTTEANDTSKPLPHATEMLGDVAAGATVERTLHAAFFGQENQKVIVPVTLEYKASDSAATFVKKTQYEFLISTSPVGISVTSLSEVATGQSLTLSVLVRSNASAPLENVAVRAEYPFGFSPKSQSPEPLSGSSLFSIGTLAPGEEREIRVTGTLSGQEGESRVFKFTAGSLKSADSREFGISYTQNGATVSIAKPFFTVGLDLNRDSAPTIVAKAGEPVLGLLTWTNALESSILDGQISVALSGEALDGGKTEVTNGFYQSSNKTIVFNRDTAPGLASLNPGDTGNGQFTLHTKSGSAVNSLRNPTITISISVSGRRVAENKVAETVSSTLTKTIKIQSDLSLGMTALRTKGPFTNTGPWPPEADKESTYTIQLTAGNTVNTVANTTVTTTLPSYVRFAGQVSPTGAITYNESTRAVTWNIGDFPPGTNKEAYFQVVLLPSVSQKGTSPTLVSSASITGFDRFVQKQVTAGAPLVNTDTKSDPAYQSSTGIVK